VVDADGRDRAWASCLDDSLLLGTGDAPPNKARRIPSSVRFSLILIPGLLQLKTSRPKGRG